jgi:serine/threonine protein kinase
MSSPPPLLPDNTVINDRYRLECHIGTGGFASVYKAFDLIIERHVAIKVLNIHALGTGDEEHKTNLARFRQEAKAAAKIQHPAVVTIYDIGATSDYQQPFIVMEFLSGRSLKEVLVQEGALKATRAQRLLVPCIEALGEGHALGIIHKDLKPGNLFLTGKKGSDERLRLLDYGVARLQSESRAMTMGNQIVGTIAYLAPEYLVKQEVSPALDVYQAGLIFSEMLMGEGVVQDVDMINAANRHRFATLEIASELLKTPVAPVLARSMAREPEDRYPDCSAMAHAVRGLDLSGVPRLLRGGPRGLLTSVERAPIGRPAVVREETVSARVEDVAGPAVEDDQPTAPSPALREDSEPVATEVFDSSKLPALVVPHQDANKDPFEGETRAVEVSADSVPAPLPTVDGGDGEAGARGIRVAVAGGAAVVAMLLFVIVVVGALAYLAANGGGGPPPRPDAGGSAYVNIDRLPDIDFVEVVVEDVGLATSDADSHRGPDGENVPDTGGGLDIPEAAHPHDAGVGGVDGGSNVGAQVDAAAAPDGIDATPAAEQEVRVQTRPVSAAVFRGHKRLGRTPVSVRVPTGGVRLTFRAQGYRTLRRLIEPNSGAVVVTLKRRRTQDKGIGIAK